jgi:5-(carboxyamino)imidazole ribonucleotide synthase
MRVGIVGGGQLGRMLALAGYPLDIRCTTLDPARDSPASQVAPSIVGAYDDQQALARLADGADVVARAIPGSGFPQTRNGTPSRPCPHGQPRAKTRGRSRGGRRRRK